MADLRPQYHEEAVGANHPIKDDVINRAWNVEHAEDGTHKPKDVDSFGGLAAAVATWNADGSDVTLQVTTSQTSLSANLTVNSNISLVALKEGLIPIDTGKTLTINGPFEAGLYQVFSGAGSVSFGVRLIKEIHPEWWGALPDGSTNIATEFTKAMTAADACESSLLLAGNSSYPYYFTVGITIPAGLKIKGSVQGKHELTGSTLEFSNSPGTLVTLSDSSILEDFYIKGADKAGSIAIIGDRYNEIKRIQITNVAKGIDLARWSHIVDSCVIKTLLGNSTGIELGSAAGHYANDITIKETYIVGNNANHGTRTDVNIRIYKGYKTRIENCNLGSGKYAIDILGGGNVSLSGNYAETVDSAFVHVNDAAARVFIKDEYYANVGHDIITGNGIHAESGIVSISDSQITSPTTLADAIYNEGGVVHYGLGNRTFDGDNGVIKIAATRREDSFSTENYIFNYLWDATVDVIVPITIPYDDYGSKILFKRLEMYNQTALADANVTGIQIGYQRVSGTDVDYFLTTEAPTNQNNNTLTVASNWTAASLIAKKWSDTVWYMTLSHGGCTAGTIMISLELVRFNPN